jgi:hypothetical protein
MAGSGFFALLDDIATLLDDVSVMTKVAAKKTAGVLGDDLALNAEQVAGVAAHRELPVVWAVAKGSAINKLILVPSALALSVLTPWAVKPLLMAGGAFLCYEGVEKVLHSLFHGSSGDDSRHHHLHGGSGTEDLVAYERGKIKGAVRTDFILSAEIIVITLGTVAAQSISRQIGVLTAISVLMTVGVYGLVASIVKLDDAGFSLRQHGGKGGALGPLFIKTGDAILTTAPLLMRGLSFAGTLAMFLVGGHIIVEGITPLHHFAEAAEELPAGLLLAKLFDVLIGAVCGGVVLGGVTLVSRLRGGVN